MRVALLSVAVVLAATAVAVGAAGSSVRLPAGATFGAVEPLTGGLLVSGFEASGPDCRWLVVDPVSLRVRSSLRATCDRPPIAAAPVVPIEFPIKGSNSDNLRIARPNRDGDRVSYGPVVMTYASVSDTHLEWTYGPGTLWVYNVATRHGPEVLDISTATGRVVRTVRMPALYEPLLAADADGLWIAASPETGAGTPAPIYRLAPTAMAPRIVHRGGYATLWLVAAGHTVWADIGTLPHHGSASTPVRQEVWRFDGPAPTARDLASADGLNAYPNPVLQPGGQALWTISLVPTQGNYRLCLRAQLVRIDANTGRQTVTRTVSIVDQSCLPVQSQAFVDGAFYFLSPYINQTLRTTLYRLQP